MSLAKKDLSKNSLHIDGVETGGPVLAQPVPPVVGVHPEVVERTAEDLERQTVQVKGVPLSGLWGEGSKHNIPSVLFKQPIFGPTFHLLRYQQIKSILPKPEVMPSPLTPGVKYSYKVTP